ncbi:transaldolase family protein [Lachnospiraceae bacterium ASD3451]|nr:transaldolase family protein [Diplocloster agilis]
MGQNEYLRWLSSETPSIYWHDSANLTAIEEAIRNGATGVTTNPFLVQDTLAGSPDDWEEDMAAVKTLPPGPEKAEAKIAAVAGRIAKRMEREHRGFGTGYCCAQTDPTRPGDAIRMIE